MNADIEHLNAPKEEVDFPRKPAQREKSLANLFNQSAESTSLKNDGEEPSNGHISSTSEKKLTPIRKSIVNIGHTKWLKLNTVTYIDEDGISRKWDTATRTTKLPNIPDAVIIIPIMRSKNNDVLETLVVEQYRPPIAQYALEFPAGLVDAGESAGVAALRELYEETGYTGTVDEQFFNMDELCMSPGLTDETVQIVVVNIDLDDPKNIHPKQNLEDGEAIVVKRAPLTTTLKKLLGESTSMPISLLYSFALGLEIGAKYLKSDS